MAKKKGQAPKTFPKVGQEWRDDSGKIPHYLLITATGMDTDKKQTWECEDESEDEEGKKAIATRTLHLADFQESWIQIEHDPEADEKIPAPEPAEPEIMVLPIKNGFTFKCSSPACGDTHDVENAMPFNEVTAEHDRFKERHRAHLSVGRLGAVAE